VLNAETTNMKKMKTRKDESPDFGTSGKHHTGLSKSKAKA
jgi:hypothetical protein